MVERNDAFCVVIADDLRDSQRNGSLLGVICMPFENFSKCQFVKIDLQDKVFDKKKKLIIEKQPIIVEFSGTYKRSTLITNDRLLLFGSKDVKLVDLSDRDRKDPVSVDMPHKDLGEIHRSMCFVSEKSQPYILVVNKIKTSTKPIVRAP